MACPFCTHAKRVKPSPDRLANIGFARLTRFKLVLGLSAGRSRLAGTADGVAMVRTARRHCCVPQAAHTNTTLSRRLSRRLSLV
jgi:hypothetical protein